MFGISPIYPYQYKTFNLILYEIYKKYIFYIQYRIIQAGISSRVCTDNPTFFDHHLFLMTWKRTTSGVFAVVCIFSMELVALN